MKDYTYLYKEELPVGEVWPERWDIFISSYNESERVRRVYDKINAATKHWIIHAEYGYEATKLPVGEIFQNEADQEGDFINSYYDTKLQGIDVPKSRICIDITGFMRPHMMFLIKLLVAKGLQTFDVIYSEPSYYVERENTGFSLGSVGSVRQVAGFEGLVNNDTTRDLLIVGAGFEYELIAEVAEDKDDAKKLVLFGLPSLSADMYQQNVLRTHLAADSLGEIRSNRFFAPANDPFATATVLSEIISRYERGGPVTNLYLSPLSTKAQALGFALYHMGECSDKNASIIFPFSAKYSGNTSDKLARVWKYHLEFPIL